MIHFSVFSLPCCYPPIQNKSVWFCPNAILHTVSSCRKITPEHFHTHIQHVHHLNVSHNYLPFSDSDFMHFLHHFHKRHRMIPMPCPVMFSFTDFSSVKICISHQICINRSGTSSSFIDCPYNKRLTTMHVSACEDTLLICHIIICCDNCIPIGQRNTK